MYQPYDEKTASPTDRVAWALCQIIDDDAPLRWTRYRFAAECIAGNSKLMADLQSVAGASSEIARLQAQVAELAGALQALMRADMRGHELADRLQFSTPGREILEKCRAALAAAGR